MLWSDRSEEQSRGSLRHALSELRKGLAEVDPSPLITDRETARLDGAAIEVDAVTFEQLIDDDTPEALARAAELYQGDLLDGFEVRDAAFEDLLRDQRERFRERAGAAFSRLVDHQSGDQAVATARRLLALDPLNEASHRVLMRLYAAGGDRAMALKQYEACGEVLRAELELKPDAETERLLGDIRDGESVVDETAAPAAAAEPLPLPDKPSIAVLPFTNMSGDPEQGYFCDGITEDIITELSRFRSLFVIARNSSFAYKGQSVNVGRIGQELGVAYVVEGSVRKAGNRVRITAQLVEAATGNHIWAERYDRELEDIFAVQDEVTGMIVSTLTGHLDEFDRQRVMGKKTEDLAAYDFLLLGDQCLTQHSLDGILQAQQMFQQAIDLEPGNARAHTGLSRSYLEEHWLDWTSSEVLADKAFDLAKKAVSLDERDGRARIQLAVIYFFVKSNLELAEIQFDKAFDLNPNDADGYCFKGWCYALSGQAQQAIVCSDQAIRLSPFDIYDCQLAQAVSAYTARQYEEALIKLGSIADPGFEITATFAACYAQLGRNAEAKQAMADFMATAREEISDYPGEDHKAWRGFWAHYWPFKETSDHEHLLDGLRKAGLPV